MVAALALATGSANASQLPASTAAADQFARAEAADRIVNIMEPADTLLQAEVAGWRRVERTLILRQPVMPRLEEKCPGITDAIINAAAPIAAGQLRKIVSNNRPKQRAILADGLSLADLNAVYAFVSTGAGQRYFRGTYNFSEVPPEMDTFADRSRQTGQFAPTNDEITAIERAAGESGNRELSGSDRRAWQKFRESEAGRRFISLQPALNAVVIQSVKDIDPEMRRQEAALMQTAGMEYIHEHCGKAR